MSYGKRKKILFKGFDTRIRNIFSYYLQDIAMCDGITITGLLRRINKAAGLTLTKDYIRYLNNPAYVDTKITINSLANIAYAAGGSFEGFCQYYLNYVTVNKELEQKASI